MNIIITMAGMGSRFKEAGYNVPKYEIIVKGKSLFYWSIFSLNNFINIASNYIFIVRKEDEARSFIETECKALNIKKYKVVEIDFLTDGQATTVLFAKEFWKENESLLIYNIDTHVNPIALDFLNEEVDGWIPCFEGEGEKWSFVKLNDLGEAIEVREKKRISQYATIGLYWFSEAKLYLDMYQRYFAKEGNEEKGEKYIAPLYNQMISDGLKVKITNIPNEHVHILGTPEDVKVFISNDYV